MARGSTDKTELGRASGWLLPVSDTAPGGDAVRDEATYESLRNEIGKLESPSSDGVDWALVVSTGEELMTRRGKDLLVAAYTAYGLYKLDKLPGLAQGLSFVAELLDAYWETMHPPQRRLRGRVSALAWLLERIEPELLDMEPSANDRATVTRLEGIVRRLSDVVAERFAEAAPATRPIREAVERLKLSVPEPPGQTTPRAATTDPLPTPAAESRPLAQSAITAPAEPCTRQASETRAPNLAAPLAAVSGSASGTSMTVASSASVGATAARRPAASLPEQLEPAAAPTSPVEADTQVRALGKHLVELAVYLRSASPTDPQAYRLMRMGLWLPVVAAPPVLPNGTTRVPALPAALRVRLAGLRNHGAWAELLQAAEQAFKKYRLCLDLQRFVDEGLAALGPSYQQARRAIAVELLSLLARVPDLPAIKADDGAPLADSQTTEWIEETKASMSGVSTGLTESLNSDSAGDAAMQTLYEQARDLLEKGKARDALALGQRGVDGARAGRERFMARLLLAGLCMKANAQPIALAIYQCLDDEMGQLRLETWEPALAKRCLVDHIRCLRAFRGASDDKTTSQIATQLTRLSQIDTGAAFQLAQLKSP